MERQVLLYVHTSSCPWPFGLHLCLINLLIFVTAHALTTQNLITKGIWRRWQLYRVVGGAVKIYWQPYFFQEKHKTNLNKRGIMCTIQFSFEFCSLKKTFLIFGPWFSVLQENYCCLYEGCLILVCKLGKAVYHHGFVFWNPPKTCSCSICSRYSFCIYWSSWKILALKINREFFFWSIARKENIMGVSDIRI